MKKPELKNRISLYMQQACVLENSVTLVIHTIFHTIIHPIFLYGAETQITNKNDESKLIVLKNKALRKVCGPTNKKWRMKDQTRQGYLQRL